MAESEQKIMGIDYVVPMVFHEDTAWQASFNEVGRRFEEDNPYEFVRYRSWDTERLLIQCVKKFMPFVRDIIVILAMETQKQDWMDEEGVRVVYHKDFIPKEFLPTFNSRIIEMFLYRIPGLSDRFIYGNDDMCPVSMMEETDFFEGMVPCLHYNEKPFPEEPNAFHYAARNGLNFIAQEFGKHYTDTWLKGGHSLTPMLKSTWEYLWKRDYFKMKRTITPFREIKNYNQWLCPWWHYLSGNYVDHTPRRKYVSVRKSVDEVYAALLDENVQVVCVNDNECEDDYMLYGEAVKSALRERLNKCK